MSEENSPQMTEGTTEEETEENSGQTVLYAHVRDAMTKQDLLEIKDALEGVDFELVPAESGNHVMVKRSDSGEDALGAVFEG